MVDMESPFISWAHNGLPTMRKKQNFSFCYDEILQTEILLEYH